MKKVEHLTENELNDYLGGTLEKQKREGVGRHLLECDHCLNKLPQPTPEQFFTALLGKENDKDDGKSDFSEQSGFLSRLFAPQNVLAWGAGGLAIALIFMVFVGFKSANPSAETTEIAQAFETEIAESKQTEPDANKLQPIVSVSEKTISSFERSRAAVVTKSSKPELQAQNHKLSIDKLSASSEKTNSDKNPANISSTRGNSTEKCGEENQLEMEYVAAADAITFRWKKVENAVKYHLYISDDDEILIDEYETAADTFYVLEKKLDETKTYQWKVIITLEDGRTASGASQKFTIKDVRQNQKKLIDKKKSEIRCSENK